MVRTLVFVTGLFIVIGGAGVIASGFAAREPVRALAVAAPVAPAVPRTVVEEARWTTVPMPVRSTDGYQRIAAVEAPRDLNVPAGTVADASIPLPPPRPPSTEWLREGDRAHVAEWCRSEREARRLCRQMHRPAREARGRRTAGARVVVDIRRADRRRVHVARQAAPSTVAHVGYERSPMFDLMR